MQTTQADTSLASTHQKGDTPFSRVWGNEMQREDFLALAAGVRQFSIGLEGVSFVPCAQAYPAEHTQYAIE